MDLPLAYARESLLCSHDSFRCHQCSLYDATPFRVSCFVICAASADRSTTPSERSRLEQIKESGNGVYCRACGKMGRLSVAPDAFRADTHYVIALSRCSLCAYGGTFIVCTLHTMPCIAGRLRELHTERRRGGVGCSRLMVSGGHYFPQGRVVEMVSAADQDLLLKVHQRPSQKASRDPHAMQQLIFPMCVVLPLRNRCFPQLTRPIEDGWGPMSCTRLTRKLEFPRISRNSSDG